MGFQRCLRVLTCTASLGIIVVFYISFLAHARMPERASLPQRTIPSPDAGKFLPANAKLLQRLEVDFNHTGKHDFVAFSYTFPPDRPPYYKACVGVIHYTTASGWAIAYKETDQMGPGDNLTIGKVISSGGKEGMVIVYYHSGAGTTTDWKIVAGVNGRLIALDPAPIRAKVLKRRGYVFMGYNRVTVEGDRVIEEIPGYTRGEARCCPNRPSIDMRVRFTGSAIKLDSVSDVPNTP